MTNDRLLALTDQMRAAIKLPAGEPRDFQFGSLLQEAVNYEKALSGPEHVHVLAGQRRALDMAAYHIAIPQIGNALLGDPPAGQRPWQRQDQLNAIVEAVESYASGLDLSESESSQVASAAVEPQATPGTIVKVGEGIQWQAIRSQVEEYVKARDGEVPSKKFLCKHFGCARNTMDKAFKESTYLTARWAYRQDQIKAGQDPLTKLIVEQERDQQREKRQQQSAKYQRR